jgi:hypothetical protein
MWTLRMWWEEGYGASGCVIMVEGAVVEGSDNRQMGGEVLEI